MDQTPEARLARLGVELPVAAAPAANYTPCVQNGNVLYISGQLPLNAQGVTCRGRLGESVSLEDGRRAARLCAINLLAQAKAALNGELGRIQQVLKVTVFVASSPDFGEQHLVANGASDFLAEALGDGGRHARAAIGVVSLPLNAAVEVDAIIAVST